MAVSLLPELAECSDGDFSIQCHLQGGACLGDNEVCMRVGPPACAWDCVGSAIDCSLAGDVATGGYCAGGGVCCGPADACGYECRLGACPVDSGLPCPSEWTVGGGSFADPASIFDEWADRAGQCPGAFESCCECIPG